MAYVLILVVLGAAVYLISAPLRAVRRPAQSDHDAAELAELEAARDAKYSEIRDAELDLRTGKLSDGDYEAIDGALRAEAVDILHRLDEARESQQIPSSS
jgi:hypothetical protein